MLRNRLIGHNHGSASDGAHAEIAFLALGPGAARRLTEAGATATVRIRAKMARTVELAALLGEQVIDTAIDTALDMAAEAGRFADGDLASIADHLAQV